jgi:hypothetical protein
MLFGGVLNKVGSAGDLAGAALPRESDPRICAFCQNPFHPTAFRIHLTAPLPQVATSLGRFLSYRFFVTGYLTIVAQCGRLRAGIVAFWGEFKKIRLRYF